MISSNGCWSTAHAAEERARGKNNNTAVRPIVVVSGGLVFLMAFSSISGNLILN
jgi:hypothetical protein